MIPLTSEQDKTQLKEHALELIKRHSFEGIRIIAEVLKAQDIEIENADFFLRKSCEKDQIEVVKYLLEHLKKRGENIRSNLTHCLNYSSQAGHLEIVKYAVDQGADVQNDYHFPLRWAASHGHLETVKYLVESGSDIHALNNCALRWSTEDGHLEIVKYLIENGANTVALYVNEDEENYIEEARKKGHTAVVEYLEGIVKND